MILDMGIHDFDLARWFMGEVATVPGRRRRACVSRAGAVGDIDNAIISLVFTSGRLGGGSHPERYLWLRHHHGAARDTGHAAGRHIRETPLMIMTKGMVAHDTVPYFMERFEVIRRSSRTSRRTCCRSDSHP